MKPTASKLVKQKVTHVIHEKELYFDVNEVKQLYPHCKFPPEKIIQVPISGMYTNVIRPQDIEMMTDFDKKVLHFMKFNPKENR